MDWLPDLVLFEDYDGNWDRYLAAIYEYFCKDFVRSKPDYLGKKLALKRHPIIEGKEATFWHMITEGKVESERTPDLRRCERIRWPKPIIEKAHTEPSIKMWEEERRRETRIHLWLEEKEYLVVLADRKNYVLFWTGFLVTRSHQKRKLEKRYQQYIASKS